MEDIKKNIMEKFHQSIQEQLKKYEDELKTKIYNEIKEYLKINQKKFENDLQIIQNSNIEISKNLITEQFQELEIQSQEIAIKKEKYSDKFLLKKRKSSDDTLDNEYGHAFIETIIHIRDED